MATLPPITAPTQRVGGSWAWGGLAASADLDAGSPAEMGPVSTRSSGEVQVTIRLTYCVTGTDPQRPKGTAPSPHRWVFLGSSAQGPRVLLFKPQQRPSRWGLLSIYTCRSAGGQEEDAHGHMAAGCSAATSMQPGILPTCSLPGVPAPASSRGRVPHHQNFVPIVTTVAHSQH